MQGAAPQHVRWYRSGDRVTASFGPCRVAVTFPPGVGSGRELWMDPPDAPADFTLAAKLGASVRPDVGLRFARFDDAGFDATSALTTTAFDWASGTGTVAIADDGRDDPVRFNATMEAMVSVVYAHVLRLGGLALHATTFVLDGRAWVVAGPSGVGKTTLSQRFPDALLQDELALLVPGRNGQWNAWRHAELRGPRDDRPWIVPLAGVRVLSPDRSATRRRPIPPSDALAAVVPHALFAGGATGPRMLDNAVDLVTAFPPCWLDHRLSDPVSEVAACIRDGADG